MEKVSEECRACAPSSDASRSVGCGARREGIFAGPTRSARRKRSTGGEIDQRTLCGVAATQVAALSKQIGIDVETLLEELQFIRTLDPYPGRRYSSEEPILISPEIYIEKLDENDDEYIIYFADDGSPRLRVSQQYQQMLSQGVSNETKSFIREKMRSAVDLLRNIEHRRQTIYKVVESIVQRQKEFGPRSAIHQADDVERHCRRHRHAPFDCLARGES